MSELHKSFLPREGYADHLGKAAVLPALRDIFRAICSRPLASPAVYRYLAEQREQKSNSWNGQHADRLTSSDSLPRWQDPGTKKGRINNPGVRDLRPRSGCI